MNKKMYLDFAKGESAKGSLTQALRIELAHCLECAREENRKAYVAAFLEANGWENPSKESAHYSTCQAFRVVWNRAWDSRNETAIETRKEDAANKKAKAKADKEEALRAGTELIQGLESNARFYQIVAEFLCELHNLDIESVYSEAMAAKAAKEETAKAA